MKTESKEKKLITNPIKAIRAFCVECCGGSAHEVSLCTATECQLYEFRFGKNPYRSKREMSEEQRAAASERLRQAREKKNANQDDTD